MARSEVHARRELQGVGLDVAVDMQRGAGFGSLHQMLTCGMEGADDRGSEAVDDRGRSDNSDQPALHLDQSEQVVAAGVKASEELGKFLVPALPHGWDANGPWA